MALGSWKAPFPLRFGGGGQAVMDMLYRTVQAARPAALAGRDGTSIDAESQAMARMLWCGWRAAARRVAQRDPLKLSDFVRPVTFPDGTTEEVSLLVRWERILNIVPPRRASLRQRRASIKAALVSTTSTRRVAVEDAMLAIFGTWFFSLEENSVDDVHYSGRSPAGDVHAFWPEVNTAFTHTAQYPGESSATWHWRSALCHIAILIQPPANTAQSDIDARVGKAARQLDRMLPAWMSATISQLSPDQTEGGFFAGVSLVGLTAVLWPPRAHSRRPSARASSSRPPRSTRSTTGSTMPSCATAPQRSRLRAR